jgi:hypothetical protein
MQAKWLDESFAYDGTQLSSLTNYLKHGVLGDAIVAWRGACQISPEHMVDGEDLVAGATIAGSDMVHFIVEKFDCDLYAGVALQRLLASIVIDVLQVQSEKTAIAQRLVRKGDDVFFVNKKLSISIATVSPLSTLIHFAVNVSNEGTPVPTLSLEDLGADPRKFADEVLKRFSVEIAEIVQATRKVRWVR